MRWIALAMIVGLGGVAYAQEADGPMLPVFDPEATCSMRFKNVDPVYRNHMVNDCLNEEQSAYDFLKQTWSLGSPEIRAQCIRLGATGRGVSEQFYSVMAICYRPRLQMEMQKHEPLQAFRP